MMKKFIHVVWLLAPFLLIGFANLQIDYRKIYRALLLTCLPYLTGTTQEPPFEMKDLLEPELAAIAARMSWLNNGAKVFLTDLRSDDPGYDGAQFATEYRRTRINS